MTGIEVILLIIGAMIFAASFIFTSKSDTPKNAEIRLSDKQKEDIKNQIMTVFDEQMENLSEQTEIKLDKLSNEKIMEMNDYSETILGEINRNHNEVMFMYDMLNEKDKEIKTTVKSVNATNTQARGMGTVRERLIKLDETLDDKLDKNQKIMTLYNNGYNDIDIAKRLKFGVGEVRLVIKLYVNAAGE